MKEFRRVLVVTLLGLLLIPCGLLLLYLVSAGLHKLGLSGDSLSYIVAVGLAVLLPGSFLLAGSFIPTTIDRKSLWHHPHLTCPSCGAIVLLTNPGAKPKIDPWDHELS